MLRGAGGEMSLTPFVSWALVSIVVGFPAFTVWCCLRLSGRIAQAEEEITAAELGEALARNRFPAKTIVRTTCKVCHQEIDRLYVDFRPDLGAVHIVPGLHLRCRKGGLIELDLDHFATVEDFKRHLRALEGVQDHA